MGIDVVVQENTLKMIWEQVYGYFGPTKVCIQVEQHYVSESHSLHKQNRVGS